MKKIPTLFQRDPDDRRYVLPAVTPGCEWVLAGEGEATRKYDGTCVMFDGHDWWARREVKLGKADPPDFDLVNVDEATGKRMGWEPAEQSGFARWLAEAIRGDDPPAGWNPGTYELCGPKINGNPEGYPFHVLRSHADAERCDLGLTYPLTAEEMYRWANSGAIEWTIHGRAIEGIVWHHPDGRMAKLKARDFPAPQESRQDDERERGQ